MRQASVATVAMVVISASLSPTMSFHTKKSLLPFSRPFHSSSACFLNRFLFDTSEILPQQQDNSTERVVVIPKDDYRTIHAAKVLGVKNGDTVRAGLVSCDKDKGGLLTDHATIEWLPEGKVKKAEPLRNGNPPGSLQLRLESLSEPAHMYDDLMVSLILALPRPLQLGRMLPMISQMGVDQLILTQARKVPKDYFGSHLFRKPEVLRERLIEGLCQAGDVRLPKVHTVKNLSRFLSEDLDSMFPSDRYARVIAHPQRAAEGATVPKRMRDIQFPTETPPRLVIAVGPEGGWEEPGELDKFQELGFQQITLGTRVLRSDCAVVSLLSLAHDVCQEHSQQQTENP